MMKCRHCSASLKVPFVDLASAPPSNAYLTADALKRVEAWYPLRVLVCTECWLVQTEDYADRSMLFDSEYAYFSSFSSSWLTHCKAHVGAMIARANLSAQSLVAEVAANDGYLLQYFCERDITCYGIEPTASTAQAARAKGLEIVEEFFGVRLGQRLADDGRCVDVAIANNVLAHVPDINDFVGGFRYLLKPDGIATFEFPHLYRLIEDAQFDTVYHEHFSYLSLTAVARIFAANGLTVFDVEELSTHGGSLRVYAQRSDTGRRPPSENIASVLQLEERAGLKRADYYVEFQQRIYAIKRELLEFLLAAQKRGELVAAYGAAAKGNTLLNYAGVRGDLIAYAVDRNPAKQGKYLPGSRIPIVAESELAARQPQWILILPWNLREEVVEQLAYTRRWGARFLTAVPHLQEW